MVTREGRPRRERPLRANRAQAAGPPPKGAPSKLGSELKALRARLGEYGDNLPTTPGEWHAAAWDYDQALVLAAESLGVPHPELDMVLGRRRLTVTERNGIEKGLVSRGIDLGAALALPPGRA